MQTPVATQLMQVQIPPNVSGGQMIQIQTPTGQVLQVQVPLNLSAGMTFNVQLPAPALTAPVVAVTKQTPTTTIDRQARKISANSKKNRPTKLSSSKNNDVSESNQADVDIDIDIMEEYSEPVSLSDLPKCYGRCCPQWEPPCFGRLCARQKPKDKDKDKKKSVMMRPTIVPDSRRWVSLPVPTNDDAMEDKDYWQEQNVKQCCVRILQEVDQPRETASISGYNPDKMQDDGIGRTVCCGCWYLIAFDPLFFSVVVYIFKQLFLTRFLSSALRGAFNSKKENTTNKKRSSCKEICASTTCANTCSCRACGTYFYRRYCTPPKTTRSFFAENCEKVIPCCQKVPSASNTHLGRDRCPSLTYVLLAWQFIVVFINIQFGGTSLCKLHYHVNTQTSILAVLNTNTTLEKGISKGAQLREYTTMQYPKALSNASIMMSDATFMFADRVMKYEHEINENWYANLEIQQYEYTWPSASTSKIYYLALFFFTSFLVVSGSNAYSNRWFGWASILWIFAIIISFNLLSLQFEDLKFCHYDCLNDDGDPFNLETDIPDFTDVVVLQNGTCDNSFQLEHNCKVECQPEYAIKKHYDGVICADYKPGSGSAGCGSTDDDNFKCCWYIEQDAAGNGDICSDHRITDHNNPTSNEPQKVCNKLPSKHPPQHVENSKCSNLGLTTKQVCESESIRGDNLTENLCIPVNSNSSLVFGCPNYVEIKPIQNQVTDVLVNILVELFIIFGKNVANNNKIKGPPLAQPFNGCATWRKTVTIPTTNLQVIDYENSKPSLWNNMNTVFGESLKLEQQVEELISCMNTTVIPKVNDIAINCAIHSANPFVKQLKTCMTDINGNGETSMNPIDFNIFTTCLDMSLLENMGIVDAATNFTSIDDLKNHVNVEVKNGLKDCLNTDLSLCLLTKTIEECEKTCVNKMKDRIGNKAFDFNQKSLLECASTKLPKAIFEKYESAFLTCTTTGDDVKKKYPKLLASASKETAVCAVGSLVTFSKNCLPDNLFDLDATIFNNIYHTLSESSLTTTTTNKLQPLVNIARKQQQYQQYDSKTIPFRKAVERQLNSCQEYLAGNGTRFSHSQHVILESWTLFLFTLSMFIMLIFILIDAVWMVATRSLGLRTLLCNKLSRCSYTISGGASLFYVCDQFSSGLNRCLYFCKIRTIKPIREEEQEEEQDEEQDENETKNETKGEDKDDTTRQRSPTIAELEKDDGKDYKKEKRCCRAMPPVFVASILATTVCLVWNVQMLFALSLSWKRWGMILANAVLELPETVNVLSDRITVGNITTVDDMYAYYGNPVPNNVPSPVRQLMNTFVQWFIKRGTVTTANQAINQDELTIWNYVFVVIYWILVYTIVCTFFAMTVSAICFIFRTRALWKKISSVSRAQKKLIRRYFDCDTGWKEFPPALKNVLKTAGIKAPIAVHFKYQSLQSAAPFPALFFWMNLASFWILYGAIMLLLLAPVAVLVMLVLYNVWTAVESGNKPLDGLAATITFFETVVWAQLKSFLTIQIIRYGIRFNLYSRNGGIAHPFYESMYQYLTTLLYLLQGMYQVYIRFGYSLVSFAFRIGKFDTDLVGFGQDYSYNSYLGLLESVRLKNEFEKLCEHKVKGTSLEKKKQIKKVNQNGSRSTRSATDVAVANVAFDVDYAMSVELNNTIKKK